MSSLCKTNEKKCLQLLSVHVPDAIKRLKIMENFPVLFGEKV